MEKTKKKKSEKFLKTCLQVLALQFPEVKIKYGYGGILTDTHVIELIAESNAKSNKVVVNACYAIEISFNARFRPHEEVFFISPDDDTSFKVDKPISEWNIDMSEEDRLYYEFHGPYLADDHPMHLKAAKKQPAA